MTVLQAYAVLGLDPSVTTPDEVRMRFRDLIRASHPDGKPSHEQVQANETTRIIIEACTVLRVNGFAGDGAGGRADAGRLRHRQRPAVEPQFTDTLLWLDEAWRDYVQSNLVAMATPALGLLFAVNLWTSSCAMVLGYRRRPQR